MTLFIYPTLQLHVVAVDLHSAREQLKNFQPYHDKLVLTNYLTKDFYSYRIESDREYIKQREF